MCSIDKSLLQEYIDSTLGPLESIILEEHLPSCRECRSYLNGLKVLDWDLKRYMSKDIDYAEEVSMLRNMVLDTCCSQDAEKDIPPLTVRDIVNLQVATFNNTLNFIGLIPGFRRSKKDLMPSKKVKKEKPLLRRIIGL